MDFNFYSIVLIVAIVLLILALTGVGLLMTKTGSGTSENVSTRCPNSGLINPAAPKDSQNCNSY